MQTAFPAFRSIARRAVSGVTQTGSRQWLNPDAFASVVDPSTGACAGGDSPANCQFGNSGRNNVRGPHFTYSEMYLTKKIPITEHVTFRFDTQFFNVFNHPNFALPSNQAGTPGEPATQTGFGALTSTISPPTGLLGVGLGRRQLTAHDRLPGQDRILNFYAGQRHAAAIVAPAGCLQLVAPRDSVTLITNMILRLFGDHTPICTPPKNGIHTPISLALRRSHWDHLGQCGKGLAGQIGFEIEINVESHLYCPLKRQIRPFRKAFNVTYEAGRKFPDRSIQVHTSVRALPTGS